MALSGPKGIMPLTVVLFNAQTKFSFLSKLWHIPSLFWISQSEPFIFSILVLALIFSLFLLTTYRVKFSVFVLWVIAVSLVSVSPEFSIFQSDNLLIETLFVSWLSCPEDGVPKQWQVLLLRCLFFKVTFQSGLGKFLPEATSWRSFTFFDSYFQHIPHPSPLGYFVHFMGGKSIFVIGTFVSELITPIGALTPSKRLRKIAFYSNLALQVMIIATSNFGTLNYNSMLLSLTLLSDSSVPWYSSPRSIFSKPTPFLNAMFGCLFIVNSIVYTVGFFVRSDVPIITTYLSVFSPFRTLNRYVLFPETPPKFLQNEFEGSNDGGHTWYTYDYYIQPMTASSSPLWFAPHNARFETVIAYRQDFPLVFHTAELLLKDNLLVKSLFKKVPFLEAPEMIRINTYKYTYAPYGDDKWWIKELQKEKVHFFYKDPSSSDIYYQELYY